MDRKRTAAGKLNPFALPTETDARFLLLMISAPALAFALSLLLRYIFNPDAETPFAAVPPAPGDIPVDQFFKAYVAYGIQLMRASLSALVLPVLLMALTFLLAAVLYRDHPRRLRRRKEAVPFVPQSDPSFEGELIALSRQAGLPTLPGIVLGKRLTAQSAQAFGVGRQKSLCLDGGLRLLLRKSAETFRAIVRHELAHIVNRDIGRTYFAQSLWIAVIVVTVLPLFVSTLYLIVSSTTSKIAAGITSSDLEKLLFVKLPTLAGWFLQSFGLIVLVLLIRAGLLRTREVYADWRAALWGSAPALSAIFEAQSRRSQNRFNPFRLHPSPAERLDSLHTPRRLFDMHFDVPFVVGVFTSLILNGLIPMAITMIITVTPAMLAFNSALIEYIRLHASDAIVILRPLFYGLDAIYFGTALLLALLPFLILAPLAAATIGLQVERQALADLAEQRSGLRHYLGLSLPAAWMGLGMFVGTLLSPQAFLRPNSLSGGLLAFCFLIIFTFFIWLALMYTRFFSLRLLGSHAKLTPPAGKNRLLTLLVAALFLLIEAPLVVGFLIVTFTPGLGLFQALLILAGITLVMLVLMALTFVSHWIVFRIYRAWRPIRCPSCAQTSSESIVVGKSCPHCGKSMTPWLYVME
jgi:Zn-dependent protease with chaperone function